MPLRPGPPCPKDSAPWSPSFRSALRSLLLSAKECSSCEGSSRDELDNGTIRMSNPQAAGSGRLAASPWPGFRSPAASDRGYKSFVFDRAAVGTGVGVRNGLTAHGFIKRNFHVVGRTWNVGWIR